MTTTALKARGALRAPSFYGETRTPMTPEARSACGILDVVSVEHESREQPRSGPSRGADELLVEVYDELRRLAGHFLARERSGHTLQPTALVHEAWSKLEAQGTGFDNRRQFYNLAARSMRRILVNHARDRARQKRGGDLRRVTLSGCEPLAASTTIDLIALDDALERLREVDRRKCRVVELRFFAGLDLDDVAATLEVSRATIKREWAIARAWLLREIDRGDRAAERDAT